MPRYRISMLQSSRVLGVFESATPEQALDALARSNGYRDFDDLCAKSRFDGPDVLVQPLDKADAAHERGQLRSEPQGT